MFMSLRILLNIHASLQNFIISKLSKQLLSFMHVLFPNIRSSKFYTDEHIYSDTYIYIHYIITSKRKELRISKLIKGIGDQITIIILYGIKGSNKLLQWSKLILLDYMDLCNYSRMKAHPRKIEEDI